MSYQVPVVTTSGAVFADLQKGVTNVLEMLIAANATPTLAPTVAATATATGGGSSGGLLAAGTYYFVVTETNGIGETTAGPVSTVLTVAAGNIPTVTFQSLKSGNQARNLYLTAVGGVNTGPWFLYADGVTAGTLNLATAVPTTSLGAKQPPATNTTALTSAVKLSAVRAVEDGSFQPWVVDNMRGHVTNFLRGNPIPYGDWMTRFRDYHVAVAVLDQLCKEIGVLIAANPGTITNVQTTIGTFALKRTQP